MRDKVFKIVSDLKYDGYQRRLASMVYNFFDKSLVEVVLTFHSRINLLLKQIINMKMSFIGRLFFKPNRRKVYSSFRDNISGVDSTDMQSLNKYNKKVKYLLCVIYLFSRYAWIVPLKDKRGITVVTGFEKIKRTQTK